MISQTTITRLDDIISRMDKAAKEKQAQKTATAALAISTRTHIGNSMRLIKQIQARQAVRK